MVVSRYKVGHKAAIGGSITNGMKVQFLLQGVPERTMFEEKKGSLKSRISVYLVSILAILCSVNN